MDSTGEVVEWAIDSTGELLDAPATLPRMADGRSDYGGNLLNAIRDSIEHVQADIARLEGH